MSRVTYEPGRIEDSEQLCRIFFQAVGDLARRKGFSTKTVEENLREAEEEWPSLRPMFEHLANTGEQFWLAKEDGEVIGYARGIMRDGVRELTEFFVLPDKQSAGVGRELLARAFPRADAAHRVIVATIDTRALARYLKAGVYPRTPIYNFSREPRPLQVSTALEITPLTGSAEEMAVLNDLDWAVLGYTREVDHRFWQQTRSGFIARRRGAASAAVGYGYSGYDGGPFALLDPADFPALLCHAEALAAQAHKRFHVEVPLVNRAAVDYLLGQGYEMGPFLTLLLSDEPFGRMENYILPAPPFTL